MEIYGCLPDGREVGLFTLVNRHGLRARLSNYGAILLSMEAPDRFGRISTVTIGPDALQDWIEDPYYLGATVGRFGNRIRGGRFVLDGRDYRLSLNNFPNDHACHLHGGVVGFNKRLWESHPSTDGNSITFSLHSPDGEEGYPGNVLVRVTYTLTEENELIWEAEAEADAPTLFNMVHHSYWNLSGDLAGLILDHELLLEADDFLPTDAGLIPTGQIFPVEGSPMDFSMPQEIGARIEDEYEPLRLAGGYDHCWVVRGEPGTLRRAARLRHSVSGRVLEVFTDQPGIQFFSGNFLPTPRIGLCLETQGFPDAPNQPTFPDSILRPGRPYRHVMVHRFEIDP